MQKFLFIARGPGEAGQAAALAKYFASKNEKVLICFVKDINRFFLQGEKNIRTFLTPNPKALFELVKIEQPKAVFFFNSKMWPAELKEKPACLKNIRCYGVDSNWLFNNKKYPRYSFCDWLERYFVLFPEKIFRLGLKQNKGGFEIKKENLKKITSVGFVPSYNHPLSSAIAKIKYRYGIKKKEKFIFAYFSGYGASHRLWALENLVKAVDILEKRGKIMKVICVGPTESPNLTKLRRPWLIFKDKLEGNEYFAALSSADLIFQHQGMVTLAQAISANVPVIANVSVLKNEALPLIHFWEVEPFAKAGVCLVFKKNELSLAIAQGIAKLLFDQKAIAKMKQNQKQILSKGEPKIYQLIN